MRLYKELAVAETMTLEEYEEHLSYKGSTAAERAEAFRFVQRVVDLRDKLKGSQWRTEASRKLLKLSPVAPELGLVDLTAEGIAKAVKDQYDASMAADFNDEGFEHLLTVCQYAKTVGLL